MRRANLHPDPRPADGVHNAYLTGRFRALLSLGCRVSLLARRQAPVTSKAGEAWSCPRALQPRCSIVVARTATMLHRGRYCRGRRGRFRLRGRRTRLMGREGSRRLCRHGSVEVAWPETGRTSFHCGSVSAETLHTVAQRSAERGGACRWLASPETGNLEPGSSTS